ncbi:unnamed protein product, partial [Heterosigma akashiwo]
DRLHSKQPINPFCFSASEVLTVVFILTKALFLPSQQPTSFGLLAREERFFQQLRRLFQTSY